MRFRRRIVALLVLAFVGFGAAQAEAASVDELNINADHDDYGICVGVRGVIAICY